MGLETLPAAPAEARRRRAPVVFTPSLVKQVLGRVASGETLMAICAEPGMPARCTVWRWAKAKPKVAARLEAAKREGGRFTRAGRLRTYCPVAAEEILRRIADGEALKAICEDPTLPSRRTVLAWRRYEPAFDAGMRIAREAQAEDLCDEALAVARAVTRESAYADHVRLTHFRWVAATRAPELFGRTKPMEAPQPRKPDYEVAIRHFKVETREDGMVRMVSYVADKEAGRVVMDDAGEWHEAPKRLEADAPADRGPVDKTGPGSEWL